VRCDIRHATNKDVNEIHGLLRNFLFAKQLTLEETFTLITPFSFVALVDDEMIGFSHVYEKETHIWDYTYTVVQPWYRKVGIGPLLIHTQIENLRKIKPIKKEWSNPCDSKKSITVFQAFGFIEAMDLPIEWVSECTAITF
jgi:N-acetylglutamate synthase-like GNAT family acetyltransferase